MKRLALAAALAAATLLTGALAARCLKTDTFRVNGPGRGETYVDCKVIPG